MNLAETAHAEVMDRQYRYQRHVYDFTRKYYLPGRDTLIEGLNPPDGGSILEIGSGTGRNLILAARRFPRAAFFGLEISRNMLDSAMACVQRARLPGHIAMAQGNAVDFSSTALFQTDRFDRIMCSYCLSMIPSWRAVMDRAASQLLPRGSLHIVDFGQMEKWPGPLRAALLAWLACFHVTPCKDIAGEANALAVRHGMNADITQIAGGYAVQIILSHRLSGQETALDKG